MYYIGLDLGETLTAFAILNDEKKLIKKGKLKFKEELEEIIKNYPDSYYLGETKNHWITRYLFNKNQKIYIVSGFQSHQYIKSLPAFGQNKNKTDALDAIALSKMIYERKEDYKPVTYNKEENISLINYYSMLSNEISSTKRKIRTILKTYFYPLHACLNDLTIKTVKLLPLINTPELFEENKEKLKTISKQTYNKKIEEYNKAMKNFIRIPLVEEDICIFKVEQLCDILLLLFEKEKELNKKIKEFAQVENTENKTESNNKLELKPELKQEPKQEPEENKEENKTEREILKSFPCMNPLFMTIFEFGINRCSSWRQLTAFFGLAPYINQSGKTIHQTKKRWLPGNSIVTLVNCWLISCMKHIKWVKDYYDKKKKSGMRHWRILRMLGVKICRIVFNLVKHKCIYDESKLIKPVQQAA